MLFENLDKKHMKYMVGYDLGNHYSQISCCSLQNPIPETIPTVVGTELYNIPTALCKRKDFNQWFYGKEALRLAQEGDGYLVTDLLEKAIRGEMVVIDEREYDPVSLLNLFVKKSFSIFSTIAPLDKIEMLVITTYDMSTEMVKVLEQVVNSLSLRNTRIFFQNYAESLYNYMLYQPGDLWRGKVVVFDYEKDYLLTSILDQNRRTTPIVSFSRDEIDRTWTYEEEGDEETDERFKEVILEKFQNEEVSVVYLLGEGFQGEWLQNSLQVLCRGRRVFKGNNLYSKGAAYSAMEKLCPSKEGKSRVFLGDEKLKSNIGLQILRKNEDTYCAIMDAGINWYEASAEKTFYLESGNSFLLKITPLTQIEGIDSLAGKYPVYYEEIKLEEIDDRPERCTRLTMRVKMESVDKLLVEVEDMGFGEIYPATHKIWKSEIELK